MIIGMPVYDGVDLLDVTGPYEMFNWMKQSAVETEVRLTAMKPGAVKTRDGFVFQAPHCFEDPQQFDVLWVPGGDPSALADLMKKPSDYLNFLVRQSERARIVASVCEGALLLAAAGLLDGYDATTHWRFIPCLRMFRAIKVAPGHPRYIIDRNRITGGGISSGLDEALALIELVAGRAVAEDVQRTTQYYPEPPFCAALPEAPDCPFAMPLPTGP